MPLLHWGLGVLSILLTQALLAAALVGIGLALRRAFGLRRIALDDCFLAFWVGLACLIFFLLVWNFFLPVSGPALPIVLVAGALGLLWTRSQLRGVLAGDSWRPSPLVLGLLALTALWLAGLSIGPLDNPDSGLYHIQAVLWAERYPAIPGLANLHAPIAFNNSSVLFDALLSTGVWRGRSNHLANGVLILVFLAQSLVAGARLAAGDHRPRRLFDAVLFAPVAGLSLYGNVSSFVTDPPISLVVMVAVSSFYARLGSDRRDEAEDAYGLVAFAALLALAVCFKLNAAVFAAVGFVVAVGLWWRGPAVSRLVRARTLRWAVGAVVALALAWTLRGVVLSGYPLFPTPIAGFPVEWRVSSEHANAELAFTRNSGFASTHNLAVVSGQAGHLAWLPFWLTRAVDDPFHLAVPLALVLLAAGIRIAIRSRAPPAGRSDAGAAPWWVALPLVTAIIAWFTTAPEPRYALPYFWCLAALCCAEAFRLWLAGRERRSIRPLLVAIALLGVSPLLVGPLLFFGWRMPGEGVVHSVLRANLNRPGPDLWFQPIAVRPSFRSYRTRSGLLLNIVDNQCWDAPLPCTPNPAPNLRLRDPADLRHGFVADGGWQMENWPVRRQPDFLAAWRKSR